MQRKWPEYLTLKTSHLRNTQTHDPWQHALNLGRVRGGKITPPCRGNIVEEEGYRALAKRKPTLQVPLSILKRDMLRIERLRLCAGQASTSEYVAILPCFKTPSFHNYKRLFIPIASWLAHQKQTGSSQIGKQLHIKSAFKTKYRKIVWGKTARVLW